MIIRVWVACLSFALILNSCISTPTPQSSSLPTNIPSHIQPSSLQTPVTLPSVKPSPQTQITPQPSISPVDSPSADEAFISLDPSSPYYRLPNIVNYPIEVVAGNGQEGSQDGPALQASFKLMGKPCVDPKDGSIYIPDGSKLRKLTPEGQVITFVGSDERGYKDAKGTNARFGGVQACTIDSNSHIYVSDTGFNRLIRKIDKQANVTTFLGGSPSSNDFQDGDPSKATFLSPLDLVSLPSGELYITDSYKLRVFRNQKLETLNLKQFEPATIHNYTQKSWSINDSGVNFFGDILWITIDEHQNLYIANPKIPNLLKLDSQSQVSLLTNPLDPKSEGIDFLGVESVVYDSLRKCLWVSTLGSHIYKMELNGVFSPVFINKSSFPTGKPPIASLKWSGIFMGADHNLYLPDNGIGAHQLKRLILPKP